jgi:hypothetical protein
MHIAPLGIVLGFSDLIVAAQRSLALATFHFVLVLVFAMIYILFYIGLAGVIEIVNPADARPRQRILQITILVFVVVFVIYSYVANLPNLRDALQPQLFVLLWRLF